jgi:hypothetical protein
MLRTPSTFLALARSGSGSYSSDVPADSSSMTAQLLIDGVARRKTILVGRRAFPSLAAVAVALAVAWGCTNDQEDGGSPSRSVGCSSDHDCAEGGLGRCVGGRCEQPTPTTCGAGLPDCCGPDGPVPRVCTDGGGVCPAGSYDARGSCPTDCAATPASSPPPYAMTFRFTNASGKKLSVWHACTYEFELRPCASDYAEPVPFSIFCGPVCPDMSQVVCGACYNEPAPVTQSTPLEYVWDGYLYENGPSCAKAVALGATRYRLVVPVYPDAPAMLPHGGFEKVPLYSVTVDFATSPNGVVEVPIDRAP